jgi:serine/threonine-protein kinase
MSEGTKINDPHVGTVYDGRYRIEKRIGAGGMANVYLAEDETLGRRVAIKVLHQRYAEDGQFVERFLREASAAARLNHPNIVQVYDRGQSDSTYYIAMEYVDGMTLKELVQRRGGLTEQEVLAYGRQALHALRFAHRNGIVHRDVKPHNMMVDTDGRLKIADFGIARAGADSGLTEAGSIVGTAQYLSPEQAQGHDVSATSDLYSLGVVMFEMATGRVPFDGESPVNVALKHVKDPVPRPATFKPGISPQLESIILKAMEKDPADRYSSADEMLADLDRAREGSTTAAMTAVMGPAVPASAATRVTPITPAVAPAASRVYETPLAPEPAWPEPAWDDEDPRKRRSPLVWLLPLLIVLVLAGAAAYFLLTANKGIEVPDVSGDTPAQAKIELADAGFVTGTVTKETSEDVKPGLVISTDPGAGQKADKGSKVNLVLSAGPATTPVPSVKGETQDQATSDLEGAGFVVGLVKPMASDEVDKDLAIGTLPKTGTPLAKGARVTLLISTGPAAKAMPSVVGQDYDTAKKSLEDTFGVVVSKDEVDSEQPAGTVVKQDPAPGSKVAKGDRVTLQVSSGRNAVPDVMGETESQATDHLEKAGFVVKTEQQVTSDPNEVGLVLNEDPPAGGVHDVGSGVTITIGVAADTPTPETPAPTA